MLSCGRIMLKGGLLPSVAGWLLPLPKVVVTNIGRNMLFDSISFSLGSAAYVHGITSPARKFVNNQTFLCGRQAILLNGW